MTFRRRAADGTSACPPLRRTGRRILLVLAALGVIVGAVIPGTSGAYQASVRNTTDTAASKSIFTCADLFAARRAAATAYFEWALGEAATTTTDTSAADSSDAANPGVYNQSHGADTAAPIACPNDASPSSAATLDAQKNIRTTRQVAVAPNTFTLVVWFKTSQKSGRLIGLSAYMASGGSTHDRQIYLQPNGRLSYGTGANSSVAHITSSGSADYADGAWHLAVVTMSSSGSRLFADGAEVASSATMTTGQTNPNAYWRLGFDQIGTNLIDTPTQGVSEYGQFTGSLRFAAAYRTVLTDSEISSMWAIGRPSGS